MRSAVEVLRGAASCVLFALFGFGALAITPAMLALRRPERCQPIVRASWRVAVRAFVALGLIKLDWQGLPEVRGAVIVANHPSLIDVVLMVAKLPRTLYVAKSALRANPALAAIVRATALPDDPTLPEAAAAHLARGWNVLVFPEGTRTPMGRAEDMGEFRRGAAQLALRTGAPVMSVGISPTRRILAKGQRPWDLGSARVGYRFRLAAPRKFAVAEGETVHAAAVRVTEELRSEVRGLLGTEV